MAEMVESKNFQEKALLALLMLQIRAAQADKSQEGSTSIEALLFGAGFSNAEIVKISGTAKSTVTGRLKAAGL